MKPTRGKIGTIDRIMDQIKDAERLVEKCRCRLGVLTEHFEQLSHEDEIAFDHVLWAMGVKEIITDVMEDLTESADALFDLEDLKLYSLDMGKVEKENKYLKSIGIDTISEVQA